MNATSPAWTVFLWLHAAAVVLDATERWRAPGLTAVLMALFVALLVAPPATRRWLDPAWFAISMVVLAPAVPDLANHHNLTLYVDLVVLGTWGAGCLRARRWTAPDDALWARLAPVLRVSVAAVYFFAGFHKLNRDFLLVPEVSCAGWFADKLGHLYVDAPLALPASAVVALAVVTVVWELAMALALPLSRGRGRAAALVASWTLHAVLAMAVFFDFSALMLALVWAFVPLDRIDPDGLCRARHYALVALLAGVLGGLAMALGQVRVAHGVQGALFALASAWLMVPVWRALWRDGPSARRTVQVRWWAWLAPAALAAFAASNYLGLRTAGTFSMFSNLRTEGGVSNHLLVPADHPLVLGRARDDLVEVLALDPEVGGGPELHGEPMGGRLVPRAELDRIVVRWRQHASMGPVRALIRLQSGQPPVVIDDLTDPDQWPLRSHPLERWLLDFRPVQPDPTAPNACRW